MRAQYEKLWELLAQFGVERAVAEKPMIRLFIRERMNMKREFNIPYDDDEKQLAAVDTPNNARADHQAVLAAFAEAVGPEAGERLLNAQLRQARDTVRMWYLHQHEAKTWVN